MSRPPAGVTLIELLVVLVLLGILLGVSGLALASLRPAPALRWTRDLEGARARAIRTGRPVTVRRLADSVGDSTAIRFLPDGRALGPGVDPWTGAPDAR